MTLIWSLFHPFVGTPHRMRPLSHHHSTRRCESFSTRTGNVADWRWRLFWKIKKKISNFRNEKKKKKKFCHGKKRELKISCSFKAVARGAAWHTQAEFVFTTNLHVLQSKYKTRSFNKIKRCIFTKPENRTRGENF